MKGEDLKIIEKIINSKLDPEHNRVFVFGSRAVEDSTEFSDYDIGVEGQKLSGRKYFDLVQAFEDSDLEFTVDLVDFNTVSEDFKKVAKTIIIPINY